MKAACITFPAAREVEIGEITLPAPVDSQLLTRTLLTGVSTGTETRVLRGCEEGARFPLIPGYENLGVVVESGPRAAFRPGERVFILSHEYDPAPFSRCWGGQVASTLADSRQVIPIPPDLPDEAAIYAKLSAIALHGVKRARVAEGESVVVVGLGLVGHLVVQHCVARGALPIGVDLEEERVKRANRAGAVHGIVAGEGRVEDEIKDLTGGGAAVVFDATGVASSLEESARYLKPRPRDAPTGECGRLVLQGTLEEPLTLPYRALFSPEVDLITPRDCDTRDMAEAVDLLASGRIRPELIPAERYPYHEAATAYQRLLDRETGRVIFSWE